VTVGSEPKGAGARVLDIEDDVDTQSSGADTRLLLGHCDAQSVLVSHVEFLLA
jgi:hypothetical protein